MPESQFSSWEIWEISLILKAKFSLWKTYPIKVGRVVENPSKFAKKENFSGDCWKVSPPLKSPNFSDIGKFWQNTLGLPLFHSFKTVSIVKKGRFQPPRSVIFPINKGAVRVINSFSHVYFFDFCYYLFIYLYYSFYTHPTHQKKRAEVRENERIY